MKDAKMKGEAGRRSSKQAGRQGFWKDGRKVEKFEAVREGRRV